LQGDVPADKAATADDKVRPGQWRALCGMVAGIGRYFWGSLAMPPANPVKLFDVARHIEGYLSKPGRCGAECGGGGWVGRQVGDKLSSSVNIEMC
jgi:hypothetical protein